MTFQEVTVLINGVADFELSSRLGGDGTALVGEAARLKFNLSYVPEQPSGARPLGEILNSTDFSSRVQRLLQERVRKEFGKHYFVDRLEIDPATSTITASVSTLLDEGVSLQRIARQTAATAQAIREDLSDAASNGDGVGPWVQVSWSQGEGLFDPSVLSAADTPAPQLEARLAGLRQRKRRLKQARNLSLAVALLIVTYLIIQKLDNGSITSVVTFYGLLFVGGGLVAASQISAIESESQEIGIALDLRQIDKGDTRTRPEKLFREHTFELKRYYDQTLSQGRTIYFVGLGCLLLGFAVIGASLWLVIEGGKADSEEKVIVGVLGAIAGILADYIAVVYLRMFSETVRAVADFHRRFVVTHHLHFGNVLASMIEKDDLREQTLATMAQRIAGAEDTLDAGSPSKNGKPAVPAS